MAGTPGKHRLRLKVDMTTGIIGGIPPGRVTQNLFADFETIEGDTSIATVVVPDASVLRPLLTPRLTVSPRFDPPVYFSVFATALPVDAAFDSFIRLDGKEYPVGGE